MEDMSKSRRTELPANPEEISSLNDLVVIPPPHRRLILSDLYSGYLDVDKVTLLDRIAC